MMGDAWGLIDMMDDWPISDVLHNTELMSCGRRRCHDSGNDACDEYGSEPLDQERRTRNSYDEAASTTSTHVS